MDNCDANGIPVLIQSPERPANTVISSLSLLSLHGVCTHTHNYTTDKLSKSEVRFFFSFILLMINPIEQSLVF
ncbi:unnamed protein product [Tuber melanosporum]|uniref:(Perigord truffle) hypothetical protein n=1 Tax=Tuber melanosporum (strain Mel28) TaxID=656061 RepID=D5G941_TUBMM|nr:uncharacterized protein GSTUM_00004972001 [Tuber melanosporum]CAZ81034.1 unnamed protein product [Tuber melanosporum]